MDINAPAATATMQPTEARKRPAATSSFPAATKFAFRLAGLPGDSWAFAVRIWFAVVIALCTSFWLQLEAPSTAALTVAGNSLRARRFRGRKSRPGSNSDPSSCPAMAEFRRARRVRAGKTQVRAIAQVGETSSPLKSGPNLQRLRLFQQAGL